MKKLFLLIFSSIAAFTLRGQEVSFHATFGDDMVMQHSSEVELYGSCRPGRTLEVRLSWQEEKPLRTNSSHDGRWSIMVPTPAASCEGHTIRVGDAVLHRVLMGDVWLCSGQSNMEMPMRGFPSQPVAGSLDEIARSGRHKNLRLYTVGRNVANTPQSECTGGWQLSRPDNVSLFSALAYIFGASLSENLDIPVGVVVSCYGGSRIESWMDRQTLASYDTTTVMTAARADVRYRAPSTLWNGMIAPLTRTIFKGVLWYQGTSNRSDARYYAPLLEDMVGQWRKNMNRPSLPFVVCQIAPVDSKNKIYGAYLMEAQMKAVSRLNNACIVPTSDLGSPGFIHAPRKIELGTRAAAVAMANVYGVQGLPTGGPVFSEVRYVDGKAIIDFHNTPRGLVPTDGEIDHFELASADGVYHSARAKILGRMQVEVWCDRVPDPVNVRYAFKSWHTVNLYNTEGLPAFPFRTDEGYEE